MRSKCISFIPWEGGNWKLCELQILASFINSICCVDNLNTNKQSSLFYKPFIRSLSILWIVKINKFTITSGFFFFTQWILSESYWIFLNEYDYTWNQEASDLNVSLTLAAPMKLRFVSQYGLSIIMERYKWKYDFRFLLFNERCKKIID